MMSSVIFSVFSVCVRVSSAARVISSCTPVISVVRSAVSFTRVVIVSIEW